ncbi:unnamed protein product [Rhizoctonia solani]|uniref:Uncharacterized protein n=1 Tax=Rhizoctonia solani TaxID=456999 RepID=A0A8H3H0Q3_9AGAM|nr:unnamed protein product [Rhizoctonia solani]
MAMSTAALKVFGIPELAHLICGTNRKRDNVNIMLTCRLIFQNIMPLVWEEVDDVVSLVSMIPGGGIISYDSEPLSPLMITPARTRKVLRCPRALNLSRFNIYAPSIKRLRLPLTIHVDEYENWEAFLSCALPVELLPSLESIYLSFPKNHPHQNYETKIGPDLVNLVISFLSSSLSTLVMVPPNVASQPQPSDWMNLELFHKLLSTVSQKCPNIRTIQILPGDIVLRESGYRWNSGVIQKLSFSYGSSGINAVILPLSRLVSLLVSPFVLNPGVLYAIAKLPALESLHILGIESDYTVYCNNLQLPTQSFPALTHLELNRLVKKTVINICKLGPFVQTLRSLSILNHPESGSHSIYIPKPYPNLFDIIRAMASYNSKLERLTTRQANVHTLPKLVELWGHFPLVSLRLEWGVDLYDDFDALHRLLSWFPLLEDLVLGDLGMDEFDLKQVRAIVQLLPLLRHLRISIEWESILQLEKADFQPVSTQSEHTLCLESLFHLPNPQQESAENVARFIFNLRPTSRVICKSAWPYFYRYLSGGYVYQEPIRMINQALDPYYSEHNSSNQL